MLLTDWWNHDSPVSIRDGRGFECWCSTPTGDFGAYPSSCPMPAHREKIVMIDMAYEHVTGTFFSQIATLKYKYYFYVSIGVYVCAG